MHCHFGPSSPVSRLLSSLDFLGFVWVGSSWGSSVIGPSSVGSCLISGSWVGCGWVVVGAAGVIAGVTATGSDILRMYSGS